MLLCTYESRGADVGFSVVGGKQPPVRENPLTGVIVILCGSVAKQQTFTPWTAQLIIVLSYDEVAKQTSVLPQGIYMSTSTSRVRKYQSQSSNSTISICETIVIPKKSPNTATQSTQASHQQWVRTSNQGDLHQSLSEQSHKSETRIQSSIISSSSYV